MLASRADSDKVMVTYTSKLIGDGSFTLRVEFQDISS